MVRKIRKIVFGTISKIIRRFIKDVRTRKTARSCNSYAKENLKRKNLPHLTDEQKREISDFWKTYGIKIKDFSQFEWYYGITGIEDPRFFPQDVWKSIVLAHYNRSSYVEAFKNKNLFETYLPDCNFPKTIIKKVDGIYYDKAGNFITEQQAQECIAMHKEVIFKNAVETGQGKNVKKYAIAGVDSAAEFLSTWKNEKDFLVQEVVKQHPFFAQFNQSSVNIIRFNSFYNGDKVFVYTPVLRFGLPGFATDVAHINGEEIVRMVGVSAKGEVSDKVVYFNGDQDKVSNIVENPALTVPAFDKIVQLINTNARKLPYFKVIGWDITVDENNDPVVIEFNIRMPSSIGSQITNGPMWGDDTSLLLAFLENKENQKKYIPSYYKLK